MNLIAKYNKLEKRVMALELEKSPRKSKKQIKGEADNKLKRSLLSYKVK